MKKLSMRSGGKDRDKGQAATAAAGRDRRAGGFASLKGFRRTADAKPPSWTGSQELLTKSLRWGAIAALGCGVIAFVMMAASMLFPSAPAAKPKQTETVNTAEQAAAGDLAEQFVLTWLQAKRGDEKLLEPFVRGDLIRLPLEQVWIASDANVAKIAAVVVPKDQKPTSTSSSTAQRSYSVTVAAMVRSTRDTAAAATRRFFAVPVVFTDAGARAAALPSAVAAPTPGPAVDLGYRYRINTTHPLTVATQEFLAALVAGGGEISRYVSPGTAITAITPPPYTAVKIFDVVADTDLNTDTTAADGKTVRAMITAELVVTGTDSVTGQYALTLTARGGRWEVSGMDAAPLLHVPAPGVASTPSVVTPSPQPSSTSASPRPSTPHVTPSVTAVPTTPAPPAN